MNTQLKLGNSFAPQWQIKHEFSDFCVNEVLFPSGLPLSQDTTGEFSSLLLEKQGWRTNDVLQICSEEQGKHSEQRLHSQNLTNFLKKYKKDWHLLSQWIKFGSLLK